MKQASLFAQDALRKAHAPLAEKLRPRTLDDYIGQQHLLGEGEMLHHALAAQQPFSMLLWGEAGCGKTTLAQLLADGFACHYVALSAVFSGVKDIREAVQQAENQSALGQRTVVFIDEIHRFNKAQQDSLLPYVENGTFTLIGATTENPSFHLNPALLSRLRVLRLNPLNEEEMMQVITRGLHFLGISLPTNTIKLMAYHANGDARQALNLLEQSALATRQGLSAEQAIQQILRDRPKTIDTYELLSAFHKSLRGSSVDGAMYWLARLIESGTDPLLIARRMLCVASEDIGNADPNALNLALNVYQTYQCLGSPEGYLALAQGVTYLALAPKSNASYLALQSALAYVRQNPAHAVPPHLCNAPTQSQRNLGYAQAYRYAHDEPHAYAAGERYLPPELSNLRFYYPNERGFERKLSEKLAYLQALDEQAQKFG
ncbi:MAG: replication-associated recombination protein A [Cardiobacteriaceae bacterium]|nr:replication-associated recombination protein A [Cardiobacteriaceae bacterium]